MTDPVERALDLLLSPALWLSVLLTALVSLAFTGWRGGGARQAIRDLLAGLIGFAAGQVVGRFLGIDWLRLGQVYVLWGLLGAAGALMLGRMLWQRRPA
jgi:uncharacterized membrane protein YeaQ/YmgE (transglycosylase-associated protein family)